jgi:tagatose-6-phosphate ketose/aldose isomerase
MSPNKRIHSEKYKYMNRYLDLEIKQLEELGGFYTASEIAGQPALWLKLIDLFKANGNEIASFLKEQLSKTDRIVLTGAGTSAFIGLTLANTFQKQFGITTVAIPTTDIVTHPADCFSSEEKILLFSFARSGNSPESVAAVRFAEQHTKQCVHFIITCDDEGSLAKYPTKSAKYVLVLPPESNDKSLAMTGSYSGMLLSGLLISRINNLSAAFEQVKTISRYGDKILSQYTSKLKSIAELNFTRAVFLGSGPLFGTATESHLKLQELTDGEVICKNETYLGFRHGPKAVVNNQTLVVYLFSNKQQVAQYENDLVKAMLKGKKPMVEIGVGEIIPENTKLDLRIELSENGAFLDEDMLTVCCILPGQMLGFFKSINTGHKPDKPSKSGAISRVVEGVKIYYLK